MIWEAQRDRTVRSKQDFEPRTAKRLSAQAVSEELSPGYRHLPPSGQVRGAASTSTLRSAAWCTQGWVDLSREQLVHLPVVPGRYVAPGTPSSRTTISTSPGHLFCTSPGPLFCHFSLRGPSTGTLRSQEPLCLKYRSVRGP